MSSDQKSDFSVYNRTEIIEEIKKKEFDVLVIGGGVTGCGIALDAISRGLSVVLIEKGDYASGTSSKSTKLIHGGLRYLKQLDVGLVRETGRERATVHRLAPHLALPEKMLLPIVENGTYGKLAASVGLWVYDFLADVTGKDKRKMLSKEEALKIEPLLNANILKGAGHYAEYRTDDARLTIELVKKACALGALALNYVEAFEFIGDEKLSGIKAKDKINNSIFKINAKKIVSAAGPWVDSLREKDQSLKGKRLHLTKGVHLVVSREKLPLNQSVYFDVPDGRMVFAIPRGKVSYIGTTDTNYSGDLDRVITTREDRDYLLKAVNSAFPDIELKPEDVQSSWAGLRPLIHEDGKAPSELSRKDELFVSKSGLISIAGGKLTGYRKMAEKTIDHVIKDLNLDDSITKKSKTDSIPLTQNAYSSYQEVQNDIELLKEKLGSQSPDNQYAWYLITNFGAEAWNIVEKALKAVDIEDEKAFILAELNYCFEKEMIVSSSDFWVRRTGRMFFDIEAVNKYKDLVNEWLSSKINWSVEAKEADLKEVDQWISDSRNFYSEEFTKHT